MLYPYLYLYLLVAVFCNCKSIKMYLAKYNKDV